MKLIISEKQLSYLVDDTQGKLFDKTEVEVNQIHKRCVIAKKNKFLNSPWCELGELYKNELTDDLRKRLNSSIVQLLSVYRSNFNLGILPYIIKLSLLDKSRTVNDLELIADFLTNSEFSTDKVKKQLISLRSSEKMPKAEDLTKLLKLARNKEYVNYENSLDGEQFEPNKTFLKFEHRCENEMDDKFFNLIQKVKINNSDVSDFVKNFTKCVKESMDSIQKPIKADKFLKEDLYLMNGDEKVLVLPKGNYEVKKFDPLIDSYLSEFFSIFKESKLKTQKPEYLDFYNKIVQVIFEWIEVNGESFLQRVKENMNGIIFKDNIIVPIKYIDLYWSNKGQMGCNEKRISIRFRVKPDVNDKKIEAYKYTLNSNIVETVNLSDFDLNSIKIKKEICS